MKRKLIITRKMIENALAVAATCEANGTHLMAKGFHPKPVYLDVKINRIVFKYKSKRNK